MAFQRGSFRAPSAPRVRGSVFAVGRSVWIACPGDRSARVALSDDVGGRAFASLGDGAQVTIVAWRPNWRGAASYRVRPAGSDHEGWLSGDNLRGTEAAPPPAPTPPGAAPAPYAAGSPSSDRAFGRRRN